MRRRRNLSLAPAAKADLFAIHRYIAEDNEPAADRLIDAIGAKLSLIAESGTTGVSRENLAKGLRAAHHGKYVIYFVVSEDRITVVRILHSARDIGPEDFAGPQD